jgi:hypothetical protein
MRHITAEEIDSAIKITGERPFIIPKTFLERCACAATNANHFNDAYGYCDAIQTFAGLLKSFLAFDENRIQSIWDYVRD